MGQLGLVYGGEEGRGREEGEHLGVLTQLQALHTLQVPVPVEAAVRWAVLTWPPQVSGCDFYSHSLFTVVTQVTLDPAS